MNDREKVEKDMLRLLIDYLIWKWAHSKGGSNDTALAVFQKTHRIHWILHSYLDPEVSRTFIADIEQELDNDYHKTAKMDFLQFMDRLIREGEEESAIIWTYAYYMMEIIRRDYYKVVPSMKDCCFQQVYIDDVWQLNCGICGDDISPFVRQKDSKLEN